MCIRDRTSTIEESLHVKFDESLIKLISNTSSHDDDIIDTNIDNTVISSGDTNISNVDETHTELPKTYVEVRNHPHDLVIGDINQGVQTRSKLNNMTQIAFISVIELEYQRSMCR